MTAKSFSELTQQVHQLNDLIFADMIFATADGNYAGESLNFSHRLFAIKLWFIRISWANKRRYIIALIEDLKSAWALSLLLKSLWNCRPKDAVLSVSQPRVLSFYDETPFDHNRAALPVSTLRQVMSTGRKWFRSLEPEQQALVLTELLTIAGAPIMWEVLRRGQLIYQRHREMQLQNLLDCIVVAHDVVKPEAEVPKETSPKENVDGDLQKNKRALRSLTIVNNNTGDAPKSPSPLPGGSPRIESQKELDANLDVWDTIVKQLRDSQKLEEFEMVFKDGSKRNIWKVNRHIPEAMETVDFIQLLPSVVAKRIFSYLPPNMLYEYGKVNKYWAYIIEELRSEVAAKQKLNSDLLKLQENMLKHDSSFEAMEGGTSVQIMAAAGSMSSAGISNRRDKATSYRPCSEKSFGGVSFKNVMLDKLNPARKIKAKPIKRLSDLTKRLEQRGAADEKTWKWCQNVIRYLKGRNPKGKLEEGVMRFGDVNFPCPLMKQSLDLPLLQPLIRDPARPTIAMPKAKGISSYGPLQALSQEHNTRRLSLWSRNFSSLYRVLKVASYESPL